MQIRSRDLLRLQGPKKSWIIERLDRKLADVIGSNIVENVMSHYREPFNLLHPMFCASLINPRILPRLLMF